MAYAQETANHKAIEVWDRLSSVSPSTTESPIPHGSTAPSSSIRLPDIIIAADSIVESSSHEILEKPKDKADCYRMMQSLSNSHSFVHTGVCILVRHHSITASSTTTTTTDSSSSSSSVSLPSLPVFPYTKTLTPFYTTLTFTDTTRVSFAALPSSLIEHYTQSDEPYDKAGGYGIQALAGSFITGINGCYYNVMGFPLYKISYLLRTLIIDDNGTKEGGRE